MADREAAAAAGVAAGRAHALAPGGLGAKGLGDNVVVGVQHTREARPLGQLGTAAARARRAAEAIAEAAPRRRMMRVHVPAGEGVRQLVQQRLVDLVARHLAQRPLVDLYNHLPVVVAPAAPPLCCCR